MEDVDHSRTKTRNPQTNGIVERFHKTVLNEFYRVAFRKRIYGSIAELQADLDAWLVEYNEVRTHQGRYCYGKSLAENSNLLKKADSRLGSRRSCGAVRAFPTW